jgi:hypothetical protein
MHSDFHPVRRIIGKLKHLLALLLFATAGAAAELQPGPCPLVSVQVKRRDVR